MSEITAISGVEEHFCAESQEENLSGALERMALYLREPGKGWCNLSGVYFVVRALCSTDKGKDWAISYERLEQDMMVLSRKVLTTGGNVQTIAEDLEALARTSPILNRTEVKHALISCLRGILDLEKQWAGGFQKLNRNLTVFSQLMAISYVLSEGDFSPILKGKGESLQLEVRNMFQFAGAHPLGLLDNVHQLIDLLERH